MLQITLRDQFFLIQQILLTPKILTTVRQDTDVVMQESRVSDQIGRTCLGKLIFTPAEKQIQKLNSNSFNN